MTGMPVAFPANSGNIRPQGPSPPERSKSTRYDKSRGEPVPLQLPVGQPHRESIRGFIRDCLVPILAARFNELRLVAPKITEASHDNRSTEMIGEEKND